MVTRLTPTVITRAISDIADKDAGKAASNPAWQASFCNQLIADAEHQRLRSEAGRVAFVTIELVHATLKLTTPESASDLACRIATTWLEETAWRLVLEPDGVYTLGKDLAATIASGAAETKKFVSDWVGTHVVHRGSGRLVSGRIFDSTFQTKLVFIATRVSNVAHHERPKLRTHSENLARIAFASGAYRCHQTAILSDPALPTSHDHGWRGQDEDVLAVADLLVIVWDKSSDGFGSLVELARQYRVPWMFAKVGPGQISPMLLGGLDHLPPILPAATYLQEFTGLLRDDVLDLDNRQHGRQAAIQAAHAELADIRDAFEVAETIGLSSPRQRPLMPRTRFRRLVNNPSLWRAATGMEQAEIRALAQWYPPLLLDEARAFSEVIDRLLLPREEIRVIEHKGRREKALAASGSARFDAETPQDWLRLIGDLRRRGVLS